MPVAHEVPPGTPPVLICWAPRSGVTFEMSPSDKPSRKFYKPHKGYHDGWSAMVRLGFGHEWAFDFNPRGAGRLHFLCFSRRAGLTCRNRAGHGWFIDRKAGSRLF